MPLSRVAAIVDQSVFQGLNSLTESMKFVSQTILNCRESCPDALNLCGSSPFTLSYLSLGPAISFLQLSGIKYVPVLLFYHRREPEHNQGIVLQLFLQVVTK